MKYTLLILLIAFPLFSQSGDFYDTYDYDMKNYQGGDNVGDEKYKEYELPPTFKKPALVNPKSIQPQPEFNTLLQGKVGIRKSNNQSQNPAASASGNLLFNPLTGSVNLDALNKQREKEKLAKDKKREFLNREVEPYTETRARRMEIIFLTTFPFAVAVSAGITVLVGMASNEPDFIKTTPGFAFGFLCASGLASINMIADINHYDEFMKNKQSTHARLLPNDPIIKNQFGNENFNFSLTFGSLRF